MRIGPVLISEQKGDDIESPDRSSRYFPGNASYDRVLCEILEFNICFMLENEARWSWSQHIRCGECDHPMRVDCDRQHWSGAVCHISELLTLNDADLSLAKQISQLIAVFARM
jgi:hypothetical protein